MSVSPASMYLTDNYYDKIDGTNSSVKNASSESGKKADESSSASGDRITFSSGLSTARIQEAMGLKPTGKLKLKEMEAVAEERKEYISSTLSQTMEYLGIDSDEEFSVYLGSENEIYVSGDFAGKDALEDALNENVDFTKAFKQLTANQSVLDYVSELQTSVQNTQASLMDYYNSDADLNDLLSLASEYKSLKSSSNIMGTLLDLSSGQTPFSYVYNGEK